MQDKIIIGLECHIQLNKVNTKLFCSCSLPKLDSKPNTHTCDVCLSMPGSKPVINKKVIKHGLKLALALNSKIQPELIFSRKSYMYPDLPSGYQRTQYEIPLGKEGYIELSSGKKINLTRVHLEEDPGALIHKGNIVLVDYNRSGIPLVEVVTEPEIESPQEAREFLNKLIITVNYLGIFDQKNGVIKADANISIKGSERVEIKNITGFKEIERALFYEVDRQKKLISEGKKIIRETRGWDANKGVTFSQRIKETEIDYAYITDPDLVPFEITNELIKNIKKDIPELAHDRIEKYIKKYKLKQDDAEVLAAEYLLAELFEKVSKEINPSLAAKWLRRELMRVVHYNKIDLHSLELNENHIIQLLKLIETGKITETTGQKIIEMLVKKPFDVNEYVKKESLGAVADKGELEKYCKEAIKENEKAVEDYKKGNEKALHFVAGSVMRKTKGKADPRVVINILKKLIK